MTTYPYAKIVQVDLRIQCFEVSIWWDDALLEDKNRFDDASNATSTFKMPNVALHGTTVHVSASLSKLLT
jgi:hypothetical protein